MSEKSAKAARRDRELLESLAALNTNFGLLLDVTKAANKDQETNNKKVVDTLSKIANKKTGGDDDDQGSLKEFAKKMPVIGMILRTGFSDMKKTFDTLMQLQERALARGKDLRSIQDIGPNLTDLTDSLTNLEVNMAGWELGLRTNSRSVGMLVLQSKLTGGDYKKVAKSLARNTAGMGISNEGIGSLAKRTGALSQTFGISIDELSRAMDGLGEDLNNFAALGLGADMLEATTALAAGLGPELSHIAPDLVKAMTSGGNMVKMAMLDGSENVAAMLEKGNASEDAIRALLKMGDRAKEISKQYTDGAVHSAFALNQFSKVHGKDAVILMRAADAFRKNAIRQEGSVELYIAAIAKEREVSKVFGNTWANFKNKILDPMRTIMINVAGVFMDLMLKIEPFLGAMGGIVGGVLAMGGVALILKKVTLGLGLLKGMGVGMRFAGRGGAAGAPGVAAFGTALATVSLQIALIAAAIGVAGAGLGILFHGFEGLGGGSSAAQSQVTRTAGMDRADTASYRQQSLAMDDMRKQANNTETMVEQLMILNGLTSNANKNRKTLNAAASIPKPYSTGN
tara:strand:+ start:51 stop:1760 length:1710 start_codon:yes stop_codon:yes gene_type:complete